MNEKAWLILIVCIGCLWGYYLFRPRRKNVKEEGPEIVLIDEDDVEEFRKGLKAKLISEDKVKIIPVDKRIAQEVRGLRAAKLQAIKLLMESIPDAGLKAAKDYVDRL